MRRIAKRTGLHACALGALLVAACGPAAVSAPAPSAPAATPPVVSASAPAAAPKPAFDPCTESKPLDKVYTGLLATARCDQERFLLMASVADQLGVDCDYCHAPDKTNPKTFDYPVMTPRKEIASWMHGHLMRALKPADGSALRCKSCHTDGDSKPVAKILGNPRDPVKAQEWMSLVMVNRFVTASGEKLKCKSCHVDNFSKPGFQAKVLLRSEQIPPH